jgi:hypothetical protein
MPASVRLNRYLAAAGLGARREVEGLIRAGRVTVDGTPCADPARRIAAGEDVRVDGAHPVPSPRVGVVLHSPSDGDDGLVHPHAAVLATIAPGPPAAGGLDLRLADRALADRLGDVRFPLRERFDADGRRVGLGPVALGDLEPGQWRPLAPRELAALRRGARLPPRPG